MRARTSTGDVYWHIAVFYPHPPVRIGLGRVFRAFRTELSRPNKTLIHSPNPLSPNHFLRPLYHTRLASFGNFTSVQTAQPTYIHTDTNAFLRQTEAEGLHSSPQRLHKAQRLLGLGLWPSRREPRSPRADLTQHSDHWAWAWGPAARRDLTRTTASVLLSPTSRLCPEGPFPRRAPSLSCR